MNETEWLNSQYPKNMFTIIQEKISDRKLRLFACSCIRQLWDKLKDEQYRNSVEVSEQFADGLATDSELVAAWEAVERVAWNTGCQVALCVLPRDIDIVLDYITPNVLSLANAAYNSRVENTGYLDPIRLNILADALEEIGCNIELISHLRSKEPHVRGCYILDLLLRKN